MKPLSDLISGAMPAQFQAPPERCRECGAVLVGAACEECRRVNAALAVRETAATVPPKLQWARLKAPELPARVRPESAIARARAAVGARSIVLSGPSGSGKTSLACALLRATAQRLCRAGLFVESLDLATARRQFQLGQGEAPLIERAERAAVLVLDELGVEQATDQAVDEVVRYRDKNLLPTIYTTPHSFAVLSKRYGDGVARRIFEGAVVINLGGQNT